MEAYFIKDNDRQGGYFGIYRRMPVMSEERRTIVEVRKGDFPAETWLKMFFGEVAVNPDTHYDEVYLPYWEKATVWWTREGGYVNGAE